MKHLALLAGVSAAIVCGILAASIAISGKVFVPAIQIWARGYVGGIGAYAMALGWLALGAAAIFASCMRAFPDNYSLHQSRRDIALVSFGAMFVVAVIGFILDRAGIRAP